MIIKLYKNTAERNRLDKAPFLSGEISVSGSIREPTSIINPSISIEQPANTANLLDFNYMYIEDFKRYYFVDDVVAMSNGIFRFDCSVDVLMSFASDILNLSVFCERNEYMYNDMLIDDKVPSENNEIIDSYIAYPDSGQSAFDLELDAVIQQDAKVFLLSTAGKGYPVNSTPNKISPNYINYYLLDAKALYYFSKKLFLSTTDIGIMFKSFLVNPSDCIRSLQILPMTNIVNEIAGGTINYETVSEIHASDIDVPIEDDDGEPYEIYRFKNRKIPILEYTVYVPYHYSDSANNKFHFLDYEPYTKIQLLLPLVGVIDLPTDVCMGKNLHINYYVDIETGVACVTVSVEMGIRLISIYQTDCQFTYSLPTVKTGLSDQVRGITSALIGITAGAISGGAAGSAMIASSSAQSLSQKSTWLNTKHKTPTMRKAYQARQEAISTEKNAGLTAGVTNYISSNTVAFINSLKGSIMSGSVNSSVCADGKAIKRIMLIVRRPNCYYPNGYNHLLGKPSKYTGQISGLYGYTELSGFHLEGISKATANELDMIDTILRSGFLLPDMPTP